MYSGAGNLELSFVTVKFLSHLHVCVCVCVRVYTHLIRTDLACTSIGKPDEHFFINFQRVLLAVDHIFPKRFKINIYVKYIARKERQLMINRMICTMINYYSRLIVHTNRESIFRNVIRRNNNISCGIYHATRRMRCQG